MNIFGVRFAFTNSQNIKRFLRQKVEDKKFYPLYPRQHPRKWLSKDVAIFKSEKPDKYINSKGSVPKTLFVSTSALEKFPTEKQPDQIIAKQIFTQQQTANPTPADQRFLRAIIVGAPNSGKSTLLNQFVNQNISAVSNKANTTYESIIGVHTNYERRVQIEFKDTPGITKRYKYSSQFVTSAWGEINNADLIMFTVDAVKVQLLESQKTLEESSKEAIKRLNLLQNRVHNEMDNHQRLLNKILILNKMDLCFNKRKLRWLLTELEDLARFDKVFYISALTGYGCEDLKNYLYQQSIPHEWKYPDTFKTTLHPVDQIEQIVKSALFQRFFITINLDFITKSPLQRGEDQWNRSYINIVKMIVGENAQNLKILANEVALQMAKTFGKIFTVGFDVSIKKGDFFDEVEARKETEMIEVVQGQNQSKYQQQIEINQLHSRREKIADNLHKYLYQ